MTSAEKRQKAENSVALLLNTLVLGLAASSALSDKRLIEVIREYEVKLKRHRIPLVQVAQALENLEAREQLTSEFTKLLFRSCVADAFEAAERGIGRDEREDVEWYWYGKAIRNALRHGFKISLREQAFRQRLPLRWKQKSIEAVDDGRSVEELFDHSDGVDLIQAMRSTLAERAN